ncbi:MAG: HNH endonuclease [Eubacteriales bacterium]|nr:HNH endonuclease [Eubacteriales bacterium]
MAREFAKSFYNSKAWKKCRIAYINNRILIDGGLCEKCKNELGYILHHKKELTPTNINDVNVTLNHCNLEYVCHSCHNAEHSGGADKILLCGFDEEGQPIIPPI